LRIAIVGTGIAGMTAGYLLAPHHDLTIFEAGAHIGGHANTVTVERPHGRYDLDTGFLVCNDRTYPNFLALLAQLNVPLQESEMSFSVRCEKTGLEYNGGSLRGLFAQWRNLFRPSFHRMIRDILRFNREAPRLLDTDDEGPLLADFLRQNRYGREFVEHYLVPMASAIWSAKPDQMRSCPARYLIRFFQNHGLLSVNDRPQWLTVAGGSRRYVEKLTAGFRDRIRLKTPVVSVRRDHDRVTIRTLHAPAETFDAVIFAAHADQTLALLADPTEEERRILGAFEFQENDAVLHTDTTLLPRRRRAIAAWNYHLSAQPAERVCVTYNLNILQRITAPETFCVSLNPTQKIDPDAILKRINYHHPVFSRRAVAAQRDWPLINGLNRSYFCGAYWGYGFHEDGVNSALAVANSLSQCPLGKSGDCNSLSSVTPGEKAGVRGESDDSLSQCPPGKSAVSSDSLSPGTPGERVGVRGKSPHAIAEAPHP